MTNEARLVEAIRLANLQRATLPEGHVCPCRECVLSLALLDLVAERRPAPAIDEASETT